MIWSAFRLVVIADVTEERVGWASSERDDGVSTTNEEARGMTDAIEWVQ